MIKSVNIFKSINPKIPIRVEFWDSDLLTEIFEVERINSILAEHIVRFIKETDKD